MCRMAAYAGPPAPLTTLLTGPPHGLEHQAWAPREMRFGNVNVDGTGIAWWRDGDEEPLRYATDRPPWSDPNLRSLAPRLTGHLQLAAVRSATPGIPHGPDHAAPFVHGRLALAHNGFIGGFRGALGRRITGWLPDDLHAAMDVVSDSLALTLNVARHLRSADLPEALTRAVDEVAAASADAGEVTTLTCIAADGRCVAAVRASTGAPANTLYTLAHGRRWPDAVVVASEPLDDDPGWAPVPDGATVTFDVPEDR